MIYAQIERGPSRSPNPGCGGCSTENLKWALSFLFGRAVLPDSSRANEPNKDEADTSDGSEIWARHARGQDYEHNVGNNEKYADDTNRKEQFRCRRGLQLWCHD
jgi:hypothetical protein